jgi:hypothetical protein
MSVGELNEYNWMEVGNTKKKKMKHALRIALLNVRTFPSSNTDPRNGSLHVAFKKWQVDIWGWVELTVKWESYNGRLPTCEMLRMV